MLISQQTCAYIETPSNNRIFTMNQEILHLLELSYSTTSNEQIRQVTQTLQLYAKQPGYIQSLIPIITNAEIRENTTCAALAQLKNVARRYWLNFDPNIQMHPDDKHFLTAHVLDLNLELSENYKYGKIIKDIITIIAHDLLEMAPALMAMLREGRELKTCMNFLLGVVGGFKYETEPQKNNLFALLEAVIPALTDVIIRGKKALNESEQIVLGNPSPEAAQLLGNDLQFYNEQLYLSIKFMTKCLDWVRTPDLRQYSIQWTEICFTQIDNYKEGLAGLVRNEEEQSSRHGSEQFSYFHGRKWAVKYLSLFIRKVLVYKASDPLITQSTRQFYETYWDTLMKVVREMFQHSSTKRIKIYEFELLAIVFRTKPKLMGPWFDYYMFEVIPSFIVFGKDDLILAQDNPVEYLSYECERYEANIRRTAADLWVKTITDSELYYPQGQSVERYKKCLQFIHDLVRNSEQEQMMEGVRERKMVGVYLFQNLCGKVSKREMFTILAEEYSGLANWLVQHLLRQQPHFLLQAKAFDIYCWNCERIAPAVTTLMGECILKVIVLSAGAENKEPGLELFELIKIKAIETLREMDSEWFRRLSQESIELMLSVFLEVILQHEQEDTIAAFKHFLYSVGSRLKNYAVTTISVLGRKLQLINSKEAMKQAAEKSLSFSLKRTQANSGVISTLTLMCFLVDPDLQEIQLALESELLFLLASYFSADCYGEQEIVDYFDEISEFHTHYLSEVSQKKLPLSDNMWFFYSVILFRTMGLPVRLLAEVEGMEIDEVKKQILRNCFQRDEYSTIHTLRILKEYLKFMPMEGSLRPMKEVMKNLFHASPLQKLILMTRCFCEPKKESQDEWNYIHEKGVGRLLSTVLLIYLVETHKADLPKEAFQHIWTVIRLNDLEPLLQQCLERYNLQLMLVWAWAQGDKCIIMMPTKREKHRVLDRLVMAIEELEDKSNGFGEEYIYQELRRIVLGLSGFMYLICRIESLRKYLKPLVELLLRFTRKNLKCIGYEISETSDYQYQIEGPDEEEEGEPRQLIASMLSVQPAQRLRRAEFEECPEISAEDKAEPNYMVELGSDNKIDFDHTRDTEFDDLKELSAPENIFDEVYVNRLDAIDENEVIMKQLRFFKEKCPQEYRQFVLEDDVIAYYLASILSALGQAEEAFQFFNLEKVYKEWMGRNEGMI